MAYSTINTNEIDGSSPLTTVLLGKYKENIIEHDHSGTQGGTITSAGIANNSVYSNNIKNAEVDTAEIIDDSISRDEMHTNSITADNLADYCFGSYEFSSTYSGGFQSVAAGGTYTMPVGIYHIVTVAHQGSAFQVFINGAWRSMHSSAAKDEAESFFSDGANMRCYNADSISHYFNWNINT